ncbi:uroporphyrinogen-III synthase [Reinekea blandensis]|uniref:Uroporphyrinogen-III synthase n=1 Tax=Reinekea blandensis MED297 TaxID=314283 RepID=A4BAP9_9GAMM|nr:uroporphyrinogen-III synthase [Reinekea blandensis]EAR11005.1 uroporphyrinogen-III synthetase [Reinekea sp. MED297] [Reinekea blandensis MED297]
MRRILIPKASREQARWQQALAGESIEPLWIDPWQMSGLPQTAEHRNQWLNLDLFSGVVCVSPTAAEVLVAALDEFWPMPPSGVHWLCNGPRTAEVLSEAGLTPVFPQQGHTAEQVLALPEAQCAQGDKWLIVKGEGGRVTLAQTLTERGAIATELPVYRRAVDNDALQYMTSIRADADALWLSSEFLGESLLNQGRDLWQSWTGEWWVSSPRLKDWCQAQGCRRVRVASGATVQALQAMIRETASQ